MFRSHWPPTVQPVLARDSSDPGVGRVLVVDDEPALREMYRRSIKLAGFDVVLAESGPDGLGKLRGDKSIRLVLLDLNMPEMDGWGFRSEQRADPAISEVPTIIVTGAPLEQVVRQELHATDYLLKPVGREHLISVVSDYCEPHEPQW